MPLLHFRYGDRITVTRTITETTSSYRVQPGSSTPGGGGGGQRGGGGRGGHGGGGRGRGRASSSGPWHPPSSSPPFSPSAASLPSSHAEHRRELNALLEWFGIDATNPLTVISQDTSRAFLSGEPHITPHFNHCLEPAFLSGEPRPPCSHAWRRGGGLLATPPHTFSLRPPTPHISTTAGGDSDSRRKFDMFMEGTMLEVCVWLGGYLWEVGGDTLPWGVFRITPPSRGGRGGEGDLVEGEYVYGAMGRAHRILRVAFLKEAAMSGPA